MWDRLTAGYDGDIDTEGLDVDLNADAETLDGGINTDIGGGDVSVCQSE